MITTTEPKVKEHGMLLSPPMVRARGKHFKTQTRRVVTLQNCDIDGWGSRIPNRGRWKNFDLTKAWIDPGPSPAGNPGPYLKAPLLVDGHDTTHRLYPRFQVGDRIWWRETYLARTNGQRFAYRADLNAADAAGLAGMYGGWKPSLFMPRRAARFVDTIVAVRPERLGDISEADAIAEGVEPIPQEGGGGSTLYRDYMNSGNGHYVFAVGSYRSLWESLHGNGSWDPKQWVWVIRFQH